MTDYIRDLQPAKWGSAVSLHGSNPEPPMSALGQKQTFSYACVMSALPLKADIDEMQLDVRVVAEADINPQSGSGDSGSWLSRLSANTTGGLITDA